MEFTANSLEQHWMPFTGNRDFKANPRIVVKGEGMYYIDHKGGKILDGASALFCCPLGHGRPEIANAVRDQLLTNDYTPPFQLGHPGSFELASLVARITPEPINHVFFVNSGSESIDTALKIAMAYHRAKGEGQRTRFVSRERAYHGVNIGGVSLAGMVKNRETFSGVMPNVVCMRHTLLEGNEFIPGQPTRGAELADDLKRFCETYGGSTIAAVFVEPIAGSTGVLVPPVGYLERLREICDQHGILLVFDEVITGFGRTGQAFASQSFGVTPDIMTMAKALTNGAQPMGAVAVKDSIYDTIIDAAPENAIEFFHGYTYSGHPAACAAGIVTQNIFEKDNLFARANKLSGYFAEALHSLKDMECLKDIRSYGLLGAVEVKAKGAPGALGTQLQKDLFWNGLHIKFTGDSGIIAPQFVAEEKHIDEIVDKLRKTFSKI
ncbi:MAG: aspartate aminotransferase family protein [Proteobacteria bacterium]|nr:aspartate aminotransferase family protein [Pseudomonadota bacterium]